MSETIEAKRAALAETLAGVDTMVSIRPASRGSSPVVSGGSLVLGRKLGEGGMAVVFSATQPSLGREVAVKTSREDDAQIMEALVEEARITGRLEHPNIVPIHEVASDDRGRPLIVLKRIDGTAWSSTLASRSLEANLATLVQVCQAVAFAHSRGIAHRDLKPANVMIGEFGEVYVLDWGIAVPIGTMPDSVAGTLAYMAPEMLECGAITARTDLYLLGAILHEIIAGRPPHAAATVGDCLDSIARSEPPAVLDAPEELAAIARGAMARDPERRFATVDAFRQAVLGFVEHRNSAEVARLALERLTALEAHLATGGDRIAAYQLFGQCRFGFQEALRTWPQNPAARAGLDRALIAMVKHELAQRDVRAASLLVADLSAAPPELTAELAELERVQRASAREMEALARDRDATLGASVRTAFVALFGLMWAGLPVLARWFPGIDIDHPTSIVVGSASLVLLVAIAIAARREVLRTSYNRGAIAALVLALILHLANEVAAWMLDLDMATTHALALAMWSGACATAAVFLDRALLLPAGGFFAALVITVRAPEQRFWAISVSLVAFAFTVAYTWWASKRGRRIGGLADRISGAGRT